MNSKQSKHTTESKIDVNMHQQIRTESFRSLVDIALAITKNLMLINGGAAVALLAFIGQVWSSGNGRQIELAPLMPDLLAFLIGTVSGVVSLGAGYFAQFHFTHSPRNIDLHKYRPLQRWRYIAISMIIVGLVSFVFGSIWASSALTNT